MTMISVHAPTEDGLEENKDLLYKTLEQVMDRDQGGNLKTVIGDLNAKIGRKENYSSL